MFCPECGAEFRPGFTECSDCQVPLVEVEPKPTARVRHDAEPVLLATYLNLTEAWVVLTALQASGFKVWLWNVHILSLYWLMTPALGGVWLVVSSEDAEDALALLELVAADAAQEPSFELEESHPLMRRRHLAKVLMWVFLLGHIMTLVLLVPLLWRDSLRDAPDTAGEGE